MEFLVYFSIFVTFLFLNHFFGGTIKDGKTFKEWDEARICSDCGDTVSPYCLHPVCLTCGSRKNKYVSRRKVVQHSPYKVYYEINNLKDVL